MEISYVAFSFFIIYILFPFLSVPLLLSLSLFSSPSLHAWPSPSLNDKRWTGWMAGRYQTDKRSRALSFISLPARFLCGSSRAIAIERLCATREAWQIRPTQILISMCQISIIYICNSECRNEYCQAYNYL